MRPRIKKSQIVMEAVSRSMKNKHDAEITVRQVLFDQADEDGERRKAS